MGDAGAAGALPTGTVTFLFTDLERSTAVQQAHPACEAEFGRPSIAPFDLLTRQGHAGHVDVVATGEIDGEAAPATPEVNDTHAGLEAKLGGDVLFLQALRGFEILAAARVIGAGILALTIQEQRVHVPGKVIVVGHVAARPGLAVALMEAAHQLPQNTYPRGSAPARPAALQIVGREMQEIIDVAFLDQNAAVHVAFT